MFSSVNETPCSFIVLLKLFNSASWQRFRVVSYLKDNNCWKSKISYRRCFPCTMLHGSIRGPINDIRFVIMTSAKYTCFEWMRIVCEMLTVPVKVSLCRNKTKFPLGLIYQTESIELAEEFRM